MFVIIFVLQWLQEESLILNGCIAKINLFITIRLPGFNTLKLITVKKIVAEIGIE